MNNHIEDMAEVIRNTWLPIMQGNAVVGETHIYSDDALRVAENLFYEGYSKRPHGKWKYYHKDNTLMCSECLYEHYHGTYHQYATNYCPNCGAKMNK